MSFQVRRGLMLVLSVLGIGLGIALFRWSGMGNDPVSAMNLAISERSGLSFGNVVLIENLLLFVVVLVLHRQAIGVGTVLNMLFVGYIVDAVIWVFHTVGLPPAQTVAAQLFWVAVGVIELSLSCSMYFTVGLGVSPYDDMAFIIEKYTHIKFSYCRVFTDCLCAAAAVVLGGLVGVGTLTSAFCLGPFINFFNDQVSIPLLGAKRVTPQEGKEQIQ